MATEIVKWQTADLEEFDTREEAETHELVTGVVTLLKSAAESHGCNLGDRSANDVADILINTDVFSKLKVFLKGKL